MDYLRRTVVCYLKKDDHYLLLFRNRKKNDYYKGKWIGVGGKLEPNESPDEAAVREVKEETGLDVHSLSMAGEVIFVNENYHELMYVYEITDFSGSVVGCAEGMLRWIPIKDIYLYPMWEGDKAFLPLLINHAPYFKIKVTYKQNRLIKVESY
ncbi:MAG: 8-oxo-dGTP diphosphatase [Erysipelotrichia bacterium]|nr:8-oxo-dGTP diphosphatase [Erysipelotrichia bacterium]